MICEHKRIRSTNCELFCIDCGEKLPDDFIVNGNSEKSQNSTGEEAKTNKSSSRKKNAKNSV